MTSYMPDARSSGAAGHGTITQVMLARSYTATNLAKMLPKLSTTPQSYTNANKALN